MFEILILLCVCDYGSVVESFQPPIDLSLGLSTLDQPIDPSLGLSPIDQPRGPFVLL